MYRSTKMIKGKNVRLVDFMSGVLDCDGLRIFKLIFTCDDKHI
jgi:hypothetical protein